MTMLLSRENIKLMMQSQKLISQEFGIRIELDNEQAVSMFLNYASQSSCEELKQCTDKLKAQLAPGQDPQVDRSAAISKNKTRYYRGQPIAAADDTDAAKAQDAHQDEAKQGKQITYRGQKVNC